VGRNVGNALGASVGAAEGCAGTTMSVLTWVASVMEPPADKSVLALSCRRVDVAVAMAEKASRGTLQAHTVFLSS